ncbi:hypothetical protein ACT3UQ_19615 [Glutamicibacter sp. AOP12-B1-11]|uniref:hypothetical protein n=1 Tax=Glutamicibacter sp. AOP12-B1-11 TaxID=3457725 RepID=UPI004033EF99
MRESAIDLTKLQCHGKVDVVIASAGMAAPEALTIAANYFGAVQFVERLQPLLAESADPRGVVVSWMAILQENSTELVDAMLAGDELEALRTGDKLQAQGPAAEYLNYASSEGSISRRLRR